MFWLNKIKNFFVNDTWNSESTFYPVLNSSFAPRQIGQTDLLQQYKWWVFPCVNVISESIMGLDYHLKSSKNSDKEINNKNLDLVNPELFRNIAWFMKLAWTCFLWWDKIWNQLVILRPDLVRIEQNLNSWEILYYEYNANWIVRKFSPDEIIAFHNFNPLEAYPQVTKWVSEVQAVAIQSESDNATIKWNWSYFKNNASVSNILKTDQTLWDEVKERLVDKWNNKFRWVENAHKTAVLDRGLSFESYSPSQREMDFVAQRGFTRDEILAIFKVPKAIIWMWEGVNVWNVDAFDRNFSKRTIQPLATQIANVLNQTLFLWIWYFEFTNIIPVDKEELRKDFEAWTITANEYRSAIWKAPLKEWDFLKINPILVSDQVTVLNNWKKEFSEKKFSEKTSEKISSIIKKNLKWSDEWKDERWNIKIKRTDKFEKRYEKELLKIFNQQEDDILNQITKSFENELKFWRKKQVGKPEWDALKYLALYQVLIWPVQNDLVKSEWEIALEEVWVWWVFQIWDETVAKFLRANINKFAKEVDKVTKNKIFDVIDEWNKEWLWAAQISANIRKNVFQPLKKTRIDSITRTEVTRASNYASQKAYIDSWVVESKEWFTSIDERVCPNCNPLHGKIIDLKKDFFKKWDTAAWWLELNYSNVSAAPLHPRCRCTIIPILKD